MNTESAALDQVYAATDERELRQAYAAWSSSYDRETAAMGYCLPFVGPGWLARHVAKGAGPILDAGCGTGLAGPYLRALGYDRIEGLDLSAEMLVLAGRRSAYSCLAQAQLGQDLPWPDGYFAAFLCTGVFTTGHAPASGLDELVRITRRRGHAVFTVRETILEEGGFSEKLHDLQREGRWRLVEESPPFRAFVVEEPDVLVRTFVFEIL
jgi:SAM-dependent methyltransferase